MFDIFGSIDWAAVFKIVGIDILLGGDNAVLIAMAVIGLPVAMQNKAIAWGTAGAIGARVVFLALAAFLLAKFPFIKVIGGLLLLWIAYGLLTGDDGDDAVDQSSSFWKAVWTIVVADIAMSIDNVVAVSAAAQSAGEHAFIYSAAGVALSIPIIIFASKGIITLMEKFPAIIWGGAGLLGWIGGEMVIGYYDHSLALFGAALGAVSVLAAAAFKSNFKLA